MTDDFADKLAQAMVGQKMETITVVLIDALSAILAEAPPDIRNAVVENVCAEIATGVVRFSRDDAVRSPRKK